MEAYIYREVGTSEVPTPWNEEEEEHVPTQWNEEEEQRFFTTIFILIIPRAFLHIPPAAKTW